MFKSTTLYLLSNIISASIPFLLIPILTRYLTPAEFGEVAIFQTLFIALCGVIGLNSHGAANRKYFDKDNKEEVLSEFNGTCFHILIFSTIIIFLLAYFFKYSIVDYLLISFQWVSIAILASFFNYIIVFRLGQWQIRKEVNKYTYIQITKSILNAVISIFLVVSITLGSDGRVYGILISLGLVSLSSLVLLYREKLIKLRCWNKDYIIENLSFGLPLLPHSISIFLINSVDRFLINKELGPEYTGPYMLAFQISLTLAVLFDAINKAYVPWLFDKLKNDDDFQKLMIVKSTYLYFLCLIPIAILSFIFGPDFVVWISGEGYEIAGNVVGLLCLGQIFGGMYLMVTNYIFYSKDTGKLSMITLLCGGGNVLLLIFLIPKFGIEGAAYSFLISKVFQFIFTFLLAAKKIKMPWLFILKNRVNYAK